MKNLFLSFKSRVHDRFLPNNISMENRLSNLVMLCTAVGCIVAFIFSMFVNQDIYASIIIFVAMSIVILCLYLSAWKHMPRLAAVLVIFVIDGIILPIMYFICGGIQSGMICWFIVGLIFPFLVLNGKICGVMFVFGSIVFTLCYTLEYLNIVPVTSLSKFGWFEDTVQSMITVVLIFGVIFKFQSKLHTKQNDDLRKREEDLQNALEDLKRASEAKSDFLANMSHEIRTPINAIMGMNEIILRETKDENVIKNSNNIQAASNNLLSIVNDILDFSKIESGKMSIIPVDYELSSVINDCYNMISMRAFNKGLTFTITNDPGVPENLYGDEFHIKQVILNLLTNAVKYTKEGTVTLDVRYEKTDEDNINLIIKVKDTGMGIADEDMQKLFKSFQRINEKRNRTIEGTGLGLIITQRLAHQMGGEILVESKEGVGSTFTAIIPQKVTSNAVIGQFSKRYEELQQKRGEDYHESLHAPEAKILVVDDVKINLTVVKGLLKATEVNIDTALSGKEALEMTNSTQYDLIFLDHMMPEMDGIETLHKLKELKNINENTPVIALTANAIKGAEETYLSEGFNHYLSKPVHGEDLEKALLKFLPKDKLK